jgi:hypothetical protein
MALSKGIPNTSTQTDVLEAGKTTKKHNVDANCPRVFAKRCFIPCFSKIKALRPENTASRNANSPIFKLINHGYALNSSLQHF